MIVLVADRRRHELSVQGIVGMPGTTYLPEVKDVAMRRLGFTGNSTASNGVLQAHDDLDNSLAFKYQVDPE